MRANFRTIVFAVCGLVTCVAVHPRSAGAQTPPTRGNTPTIDCQFVLSAYNDAIRLSAATKLLAGADDLKRAYAENGKRFREGLEAVVQQVAQQKKALDPNAKDYQNRLLSIQRMTAMMNSDIIHRKDRDDDWADDQFREANPELKRLWRLYQDCLDRQYVAENAARTAALQKFLPKTAQPPTTDAPKPAETSEKDVEDIIWKVLMRVRTAPDPDKDLQQTTEAAEDEIRRAIKELQVEEKTAEGPAKPRKKTVRVAPRGGEGGNEPPPSYGHSTDASAVTIMLLGGAAIQALGHRGGGGGGGAPHPPAGTATGTGGGGCPTGACPPRR